MRAAGHNNQPALRPQCQRKLAHLASTRHIRHDRDKPYVGGDLGRFLNPDKIRFRPRRAVANGVRRLAVVVLHVRGQRMAAWIEHARKTGPKNSVRLVRRIDLYARIEREQMVEPTRMVAMSM